MKHILSMGLGAFLLLQACHPGAGTAGNASSTDTSFTLSGKISGLDSGWVYLINRQTGSANMDSARIQQGAFTYEGKVDSPTFYLLGIEQDGQKQFRLGFFLQNGKISITGSKDSLDKAKVQGSATQDEYIAYQDGRKSLDDEENRLNESYMQFRATGNQKGMDSLMKVFKGMDEQNKDYVRNYVKAHPSSYVSAFEVYQNFSYNPEAAELDSLYTQMNTGIQSSYYGQKIKKALDIARKTAIGQSAPEFTQNDAAGKPLSLSSLKGKYVLVDFWASWCGPCRAENPNVVKAYKKYHPKGFDILGVSLDEDKDKWLEAVKKDHLDWNQVSDLQGWKNSVAGLYGVQAIPMNFLLDKDGKIIAKGLRGEDLEEKLAALLP